MTETFVDSFFWLAQINPRDPYRQQAQAASRPPRMVTTLAVVLEVMDALSRPELRALAVEFWRQTASDSALEVIMLDHSLLHRAVELFEHRPDKSWSMTDCISFIVMQDRNITSALTGDRHFEQAGFEILLK